MAEYTPTAVRGSITEKYTDGQPDHRPHFWTAVAPLSTWARQWVCRECGAVYAEETP